MSVLKIPAAYMRGGTSKGVFLRTDVLPADPADRDRLLLRITGSPDPYGKQIDGMGGATSSTSKVVLVGRSSRPDCDVDYWFGAVAIDQPVIDWTGNCGNLTAAVGPFALNEGLVSAPRDGVAVVRLWQANLGKRIIAHVPMRDGAVCEEGDFRVDGVTFPSAEIRLEFLEPGGLDGEAGGAMFPTGHMIDTLAIPGIGPVPATLINAGNPSIFIDAASLRLTGAELPSQINRDPALLAKLETIRAQGAVAMGLAATAAEATERRPHTPKIAFVSAPQNYTVASGKKIAADTIDVTARIMSMGQLHHAITGTGAIALAVAAAVPGTLVQRLLARRRPGEKLRIGHSSGAVEAQATAVLREGQWIVEKAVMSRSARRLMEGWVRIPSPD